MLINSSTECNGSNTFTQDQANYLLLAISSNGGLSLVFSVIALGFSFFLRLHKIFVYRLAIYQVVCSLAVSIVTVLLVTSFNFNYEHKPQVIACKVIGFMLQLVLWVKLVFVNAFVLHFFALAVFTRDLKKLEPLYILFSILLPVLFTWVPFINDSYGISGAWCWIRVWKDECATQKYVEGIIFQFALWYGPLFFYLTVIRLLVWPSPY